MTRPGAAPPHNDKKPIETMDTLQAILLGIVQGITEFLPVSSSGHLQIAKELLGVELEENLSFDVTPRHEDEPQKDDGEADGQQDVVAPCEGHAGVALHRRRFVLFFHR